jgi:hypothetical protein
VAGIEAIPKDTKESGKAQKKEDRLKQEICMLCLPVIAAGLGEKHATVQ